jgi:hypothetical protein
MVSLHIHTQSDWTPRAFLVGRAAWSVAGVGYVGQDHIVQGGLPVDLSTVFSVTMSGWALWDTTHEKVSPDFHSSSGTVRMLWVK